MITSLQQQLLEAALPIVAFEGWNIRAFQQAAQSIKLTADDIHQAFPDGIAQALSLWNEESNRRLKQTLEHDYHLESMKIRDRIATAVMVRLRLNQPYREAVRKAIAYYALPWHLPQATNELYRTVDTMWHCAGDRSTDFNFYTKRLLLAKVYSTTTTFWLNDDSENQQETDAFLARRIEEVMRIQKWKGRLQSCVNPLKENKH